MNKNIRGTKKPNLSPGNSRDDTEKLLQSVTLTRRTVLAKVAECYYPCWFWELQMKLVMLPLKGLDWDEKILELEQARCSEILTTFVELNGIQMPRCCIPSSEESILKIRLICLSDAAEFSGGAVIYTGRKLKTGEWSCTVLCFQIKTNGCNDTYE